MAGHDLWRWQHTQAHIAKPPVEAETFAHMPGWLEDDHCAALACYLRSVDLANAKLPKPTEDTLAALLTDRGKARRFFEENFVPFRILAGPGLLTSYFQPVLKGSRTAIPGLSNSGLSAARGSCAPPLWPWADCKWAYRRARRAGPVRALLYASRNRGGVSGWARPRNPLSRRRDRSVHHARPGLGPHRTR